MLPDGLAKPGRGLGCTECGLYTQYPGLGSPAATRHRSEQDELPPTFLFIGHIAMRAELVQTSGQTGELEVPREYRDMGVTRQQQMQRGRTAACRAYDKVAPSYPG